MVQELIDKTRINQIKDYYRTCELWVPDRSSWRSWKAKLPDGTYKRFHLKNKEELRKILIKFTPIRVYYSSVAIYNMRNVKGKNTKNQIQIFKDSIIDIDNSDFDECRKSAIEIIKRIGITPSYILKTFKGIHICYYKKRINPELIKDIKDFDKHTLDNTYNEFSVPFTLNKGNVCTFITYEQLLNGKIQQEKIYDYAPLKIEETSERPKANDQSSKMESFAAVSKGCRSKVNRTETQTEGSVLSFHNKVKTNLFIPILIYDKTYRKIKLELDNLNKVYNLGDLFCFESDGYYAFVSLKCFDERQLEKLLNQSNSITKFQQKKFHKIWLEISNYQLMGVLRYKQNKFYRVSHKHYNFIKDCGVKLGIVNELVGNPKLKIIEVMKS